MRLRPLGSTGLTVSPVGLGLAALGRPAYIDLGRDADLGADRGVEALERRCHQVLDAAFGAGVRYLDAARSYGRAEAFLASWLQARGLDPAEVTVGSKWGYTYVGDWRMDADVHEVKDHSLAALTRQLAESRDLLGGHLDLYQVHSATLDSGVLEDRAVLGALARLRDQGVVVGLSSSGPGQADTIRRALEVSAAGVAPFACVQATWNLLEPSAGPALAEAGAAGWGVIVKEAVANGRLTPHGSGPAAEALGRVAARHGVGMDAVALAAVLANPWADVVLSGAVTPAQLEANLAAVRVELDPGELEELAALAEPPERYWRERSALSWS
ncbi:MAG TPA: aldo/keto reductase [Actinomycetota bacterium]|nr:aldo/keto reductase [Actinomycetota bacterium]